MAHVPDFFGFLLNSGFARNVHGAFCNLKEADTFMSAPLRVSQNFVLRHEPDSCTRASCQKAVLFDTRESIGEKIVAHVPDFFGFLLNSGFARNVHGAFCNLKEADTFMSASFAIYYSSLNCLAIRTKSSILSVPSSVFRKCSKSISVSQHDNSFSPSVPDI